MIQVKAMNGNTVLVGLAGIIAALLAYSIGKEVGEVDGKTYERRNPEGSKWTEREIEGFKKRDKRDIFKRRVGAIVLWVVATGGLLWYCWWSEFGNSN